MKKVVRITETDLVHIINKVRENSEMNEGIFDSLKDSYRGVKGFVRGYGKDYFENMSRLQTLVKKLKNLDKPNLEVISELESLKNKVSTLNMPQQRKDALITLIDNTLFHFKKYDSINDRILKQIDTLKIDSWK